METALLGRAAERLAEYDDCQLLRQAADVLERMGYRKEAARLREIAEA